MTVDYIAHLCLDIVLLNGDIWSEYCIQTKGLYYCGDDEEWYITPQIKPIKIYTNGVFYKEIYEKEIERVEKEYNFKWDEIKIDDVHDIIQLCGSRLDIAEIDTIILYDKREIN